MQQGTMLNAYPNSLGNDLAETVSFLSLPELRDAFRSFYILPTVFNTDLDGGFSVISYELCASLARREDLQALRALGIDLTFDMILNHLSVLSPQFRDILKKGDASPYRDFFIDWNKFWQGCGEVQADGCIHPGPDQFKGKHLRRLGLPVLMVRFPDGREVPYWNSFYQKVTYPPVTAWDVLEAAGGQYDVALRLCERVNSQLAQGITPRQMDWQGLETCREATIALLESRRQYLGQMDVNVQNPQVWAWYDTVMGELAAYGAALLRLDAFTRLHKQPGRDNFMNEPETWEILRRLREMAAGHGLSVLPEIHAAYATGAFRQLAAQGCTAYDYMLPGLLLDALDTGDAAYLYAWADELLTGGIRTVNMLGCHDGIPVHDLRGLLPDDRIEAMIERVCARGGRRKMIHGATEEVYQLDCAYYTALGTDEKKLLLARAIQLFMPGKPQIWYYDLLAGENDLAVFERDPEADNREINRRALTLAEATERLQLPVVREQLRLLKLRNTHPAFAEGASISVEMPDDHTLRLIWQNGAAQAALTADLAAQRYDIVCS